MIPISYKKTAGQQNLLFQPIAHRNRILFGVSRESEYNIMRIMIILILLCRQAGWEKK